MSDGLYQEKKIEKKLNLIEELQNKYKKAEGQEIEARIGLGYQAKTKEGLSLSKKIQGLSLLRDRVKAQGAVVAADMLTDQLQADYKRDYGLSKKELERMVNEMQQGHVADFKMEENEYALMHTHKRSALSMEENAGETSVYKKLGTLLKQKREEKSLASFQLAVLEKDEAAQFRKEHNLSEKELKKISLDIQTHAVRVKEYGDNLTIEEARARMLEETRRKLAEEQKQQEEVDRLTEIAARQKQEEQEQKQREDAEKRAARRKYLETGITKDGTPAEWILGVHAEAADRVMSQFFGDSLDLQEIIAAAEKMEQSLRMNRQIFVEKLEEAAKKYGQVALPQFLREELFSAFEKANASYFLKDSVEKDADFQKNFDAAFLAEDAQLKKLQQRTDRIYTEIGKLRIDTSTMQHEEIRKLYEASDAEFEEKLKAYSKQAEFHLQYIDRMLEERVSIINREKVSQALMEKLGEALIFGAPKVVFDLVGNFLDHLPQEVKESEKNATEALAEFPEQIRKESVANLSRVEYMPRSAWDKLIRKTVDAKDTLVGMKEKLGKLAGVVAKNLSAFRNSFREVNWELPGKMWDKLYEYRGEIADQPDFMELIAEKTRTLLNEYKKAGGYDFGDEVSFTLDEHYFGLTATEDEGPMLPVEAKFVNLERLKGEELLKHPDFIMALEYSEDMVLSVLEDILNTGELAEKLPFLKEKEIRTLEGLDYISHGEMEMLLSLLRNNMRSRIGRWSHIIGPFSQTIRQDLLREIMLGKNQNEDMDTRIDQERKKHIIDNPRIKKIRTRFVMAAEENVVRTEETLSELDKTCYYNQYKDKFDDARMLWSILNQSAVNREKAIACCEAYVDSRAEVLKDYADHYGRSKTYDNPADPLKALIRQIAYSMKKTNKRTSNILEKLADKLQRGSDSNFMNEFLMCGYEDLFLHKNANPVIHDILTKPRGREENEAAILHYAALHVFNNVSMIRKELQKAKVNPEEFNKYMERLVPFSMGLFTEFTNGEEYTQEKYGTRDNYLEQSRKSREEVKSRIGVEYREELRREIEKQFVSGRKYFKSDEDRTLENQLARYDAMAKYQGGILKPVLPYLIQNETFWISMATLSDKDFDDTIKKMVDRCGLPLEILQSRFSSLGKGLYESICNRFAKEIIFGDEKDKIGWLKVFDDYFKEYSKYKLGNFSIPGLAEERRRRNPNDPVIPYITAILLGHKEGLELAKNKERLHSILDEFGVSIERKEGLLNGRINAYLETAEEFKEGSNPQAEEAFKKGCMMYMQTNIIWKTYEDFAKNLDKWMDQYLKLRADMLAETEVAEYVMSEREKALSDVLYHKDLAAQTYPEDTLQLEKLRSDVSRTGSPLQAALGVKKRASRSKIRQAKEKMEKFGEYPQAVKDCLYERMLSDVNDKTLEQEAEWLKNAYDQAMQHMNDLSAEEKNGMPSTEKTASEVLLFAYIRQQKTGQFGTAPEGNFIKEAYEELKQRHGRMKELLDQKYTWAVAFQPVFWETNKDANGAFNGEENPVLAPHRRKVMESMAAGIYALEKEQFNGLMDRQVKFLKNAEIADRIFKDVAEKYIPEEQQVAARTALMDYFRAYLMVKDTKKLQANPLDLQNRVDAMLQNEDYVNAMLKGKLMDSMDSKTAAEQEKEVFLTKMGELKRGFEEKRTMSSVANRQTLEDYLTKVGENKKAYNGLSRMERLVFALCILQSEEASDFPSMQFINSEELLESRRTVIANQLADYVSCRPFYPEINYDRVMDRLRTASGGLNAEVYKEAIAQTKEYTRQRRYHVPKNFRLLNDGAYSLHGANKLLGHEASEEKAEVSDTHALRKWITKQDMSEKGGAKVSKVKEELDSLNDYQLSLLALALNDRTMLDESTLKADKGDPVAYVNQEKRKMFGEIHGTDPRAYGEALQKAAQMLQSYQLRDDVELFYGDLKEKDFAPGALKRKTKVDWALLERALAFVKEVSAKVTM